jgi:hypothetical protein
MQQLSLFTSNTTASPITITTAFDLTGAWDRLFNNLSCRPETPIGSYIFDHKLWQQQQTAQPLEPSNLIPEMLCVLFIASELGELRSIVDMAKGGPASDTTISSLPLDANIKDVVGDSKRFRHALSEHLAFWVQLAHVAKSKPANFSCSRPNVQPEDKGPDGVFINMGSKNRVEVQSVKSSVGDPSSLVSSSSFRSGRKVNKKKLLDGFWLQAYENLGLTRLQNALADACNLLNLSPEERVKMGLNLDSCSYNAIVVADNTYANVDLFYGYERITADSSRCIATYIGSTKWTDVAETTRQCVINAFKSAGAW